ncbi:beta-N-acetylhexosaminidase [Silvibacterium acidisoli]|uniref:beta-N-acetylhexosaminidase n=1 Tax=Acidobacteriaceae bacterium ZG23-2 TaxID=2883246 RepID=UPI00406C9E97
MNLREQVGQLLIAGLEAQQLTAMEKAWLRLIRPGGVILFRRNIADPTQAAELLRQTTEIAGAPLFRCVDVEGGLVDRLRDAIAPMPSAAAVFNSGRRSLYVKHGKLIGREVKALGFNVTLAPVLDLALPISSKVMRTRVVSPEADEVIEYASAFLDGLDSEGILGCGKHFPGLGAGTLDSHEATPHIQRSAKELWNEDLAVFRALEPRLPMMMISHATYPLAKDDTPASVSPYWVTTILKKRIGFAGLVVSDDMEMGGILKHMPMEEAVVHAVLAGVELIEICKDPALVLAGYEALLREAERSSAFRKRVETAAQKVVEHKYRHLDAGMPCPPSASQIAKLRESVKKFSAEVSE